jgi:hypothetical protein
LQEETGRRIKIARERGRLETEGYRLKKDESQLWTHFVISSIIDSNGTLLGFVKVTHYDTEKKPEQESKKIVSRKVLRISSVNPLSTTS